MPGSIQNLGGLGHSSVIEHLPSMYMALWSIPSMRGGGGAGPDVESIRKFKPGTILRPFLGLDR